jgi:hypothetical protein
MEAAGLALRSVTKREPFNHVKAGYRTLSGDNKEPENIESGYKELNVQDGL